MTFALAAARRSIIFAWISRDQGQRPMLSMLCLSIAMIATLSEGIRDDARTPQSYAVRSRLCMSCEPPASNRTSDTARPRNQSFFQKPALLIASPACSYCCLARDLPPFRTRILRHPYSVFSLEPRSQKFEDRLSECGKLLNKQNPRRHSYSECSTRQILGEEHFTPAPIKSPAQGGALEANWMRQLPRRAPVAIPF